VNIVSATNAEIRNRGLTMSQSILAQSPSEGVPSSGSPDQFSKALILSAKSVDW